MADCPHVHIDALGNVDNVLFWTPQCSPKRPAILPAGAEIRTAQQDELIHSRWQGAGQHTSSTGQARQCVHPSASMQRADQATECHIAPRVLRLCHGQCADLSAQKAVQRSMWRRGVSPLQAQSISSASKHKRWRCQMALVRAWACFAWGTNDSVERRVDLRAEGRTAQGRTQTSRVKE